MSLGLATLLAMLGSCLPLERVINQPLELLLLCQQLEEIEKERNVVVFTPDVFLSPSCTFVSLGSELVCQPERRRRQWASALCMGRQEAVPRNQCSTTPQRFCHTW